MKLGIVGFILTLITAWKVFEKYGEPGWHGLIPFYSNFKEYGFCWNTGAFWITLVAALIAGIFRESEGIFGKLMSIVFGIILLVLDLKFSGKKARAFGGGIILTLAIIFLPFIANLYLGFSNCKYIGNQSK